MVRERALVWVEPILSGFLDPEVGAIYNHLRSLLRITVASDGEFRSDLTILQAQPPLKTTVIKTTASRYGR